MKKVLLGAAVMAVLGAMSAGAFAQSASGTVNVTATVTATCTIGGSSTSGPQTLDFSNGGSSLISTTGQTATFASADCNTPTHISLSSAHGAATLGGTATTASSSGGYANYFDYTAAATFSTASNSLNTATTATIGSAESTAGGSGTATTNPATGNLAVTITPANGSKLQAGSYTDTLTVTLTAN